MADKTLAIGVEVSVDGLDELDDITESLQGTTDGLGDVAEGLDDAAGSVDGISEGLSEAVEQVDTADTKVQNLGRTFDGLGDAVGGAVDTVSGIGALLQGDVSGVLDLAEGIGGIAFGIVEGVIPAIQLVKDGALTAAATMVSSVGTQVAAWATLGTQSLVHAGKVALAWAIAFAPIAAIVLAVAGLAALIALNWDNIVLSFTNLWHDIETITGAIKTTILRIWQGIIAFFRRTLRTIGDIGAAMWKPFGDGFSAAIRVIRGIWNGFARFWNGIQLSVPAVDLPGFGRVGGFTIGLPDLPTFAEGGIVKRPTLGIFGEAGPEAVVPLDELERGPSEIHYHAHLTVQGDLQARNVAQAEDSLLRVSRFMAVGGAG